jgi:hypothetical protein
MECAMTGCISTTRQDVLRQVDETVARLLPEVVTLLEDLSSEGELRSHQENGGNVLSIPLRFPDGIGHGALVARVFRYRDTARVDVEVVHDRMLADAAGVATTRSCFLNDFVDSIALSPGTERLPDEFRTRVRGGVRGAVAGVETHNRRHPQPWSRVRVVSS